MGLSYQRFKAGSSEAFQQGFDEAAEAGGGAPQGYTGGPEDMGGEYGQQPFQGGGGQSGKGFRKCTLKSFIFKYPSLMIAHSILGCLFNHNVYNRRVRKNWRDIYFLMFTRPGHFFPVSFCGSSSGQKLA